VRGGRRDAGGPRILPGDLQRPAPPLRPAHERPHSLPGLQVGNQAGQEGGQAAAKGGHSAGSIDRSSARVECPMITVSVHLKLPTRKESNAGSKKRSTSSAPKTFNIRALSWPRIDGHRSGLDIRGYGGVPWEKRDGRL